MQKCDIIFISFPHTVDGIYYVLLEVGTAYPSRAPKFNPVIWWVRVAHLLLSYYVSLCPEFHVMISVMISS